MIHGDSQVTSERDTGDEIQETGNKILAVDVDVVVPVDELFTRQWVTNSNYVLQDDPHSR